MSTLLDIKILILRRHRFSTSTSDHDPILSEPHSYPSCNMPGHHPDSKPDIHGDSAFARTVLHDIAALAPALLASPDAPSSSAPAPFHEYLTDVPPLDNDVYIPVSTQPANETTFENRRISPALLDPGSVDTTARTMTLTCSETSVSTSPSTSMASTSPPGAIVLQDVEDNRTSSLDALNVPLPPSPTPVPENMLPSTGPQSSLE